MLQLLNDAVFNETVISPTIATDDISFNGFGLLNDVYYVSTVDWDTTPEIEINSYNKPLNNWGAVISRYYRNRVITMQWTIRNPGSLQMAIDTLKGKLSWVEWFLDIRLNNQVRRITATVQNVSIVRRHYNVDFVPFTVVFLCKEPFFYSENLGNLFLENVTGNLDEQIINEWFVAVPAVFRYIAYPTSTVTEVELTLAGSTITVTANVGEDDVLVIDWEERICTLNGVQVPFVWTFGELELGNNTFQVNFTGTVAWDVNILYKISYL
jgi:hypothetical protein